MKKVAVIGHFGFGEVHLDGQTIKTKILTKELDVRFGEKQVKKIDTRGGKKKLPKLFFKSFFALCRYKNVIIFFVQRLLKGDITHSLITSTAV